VSHKYKIIMFTLVLTVLSAESLLAEQKPKQQVDRKTIINNTSSIPKWLKTDRINKQQIPDPHWNPDDCLACHKSKKATKNNLRSKNIDKVCNNCHTSLSAHDYIHVSDIKVPKSMYRRMPKGFQQSIAQNSNKMKCTSCHDLPMTCVKSRHKEKRQNPKFFRGGPYKSRSGICYHCHDQNKYQRINAHKQIDNKGQIKKDKCLICHEVSTDIHAVKDISSIKFNLKDNLSRLCWGCHPWKPHPGGSFSFFSGKGGTPNHLVKPSESILERMHQKQAEHDILFPLEPGTGKVFCGTCHNPHQKGVIKDQKLAKGADSKQRLRMQKLCANCHDKD